MTGVWTDLKPLSYIYLTASGVVSDEPIVIHSIIWSKVDTADILTLRDGQGSSARVILVLGGNRGVTAPIWNNERGIRTDTGVYASIAGVNGHLTVGFRYLDLE